MGLISKDIKQLINRILISNRNKQCNKEYYQKTHRNGIMFNWRNLYVRTINPEKYTYDPNIYNIINRSLKAMLPLNY